jgi:acetyl esterase/lipase
MASAFQSETPVTVEENVHYASLEGTQLLLDVYRPSGSNGDLHPAVILIHGGGWADLDKSTMRGMGQFLARSGFVSFSVNYRLFDGNQHRWPAQLDDVQRAVRWIRANAGKYGVRSEHIGSFGHSAGAQLAALLGMEDTRDNSDAALAQYSSKVQAVVDSSGPTDFTTEHDAENSKFLASFLGATYSAKPEIWRDASPAYHVEKSNAPFLIVHGTHDDNVPITQAEELYEKLQAAGVPAQLLKIEGGHTFQSPEARRELAIRTRAFFEQFLNAVR